jgi:hypothetical protein
MPLMANRLQHVSIPLSLSILIFMLMGQSNMPSARATKETATSFGPSECSALTFPNVSRNMWNCFKDAVSLQMTVRFVEADQGSVTIQGNKVNYTFDAGTSELRVTANSSWWRLTTCEGINTRIGEYLSDCRGSKITAISKAPDVERWRIDRPEVKKANTSYSEIQLRQGDRVRVDAGGCAQTGGRGDTWRLYVDPIGQDSADYFRGMIQLPGMDRAKTIRQFVSEGNNYRITVSQADMSLHLGYQDRPGQFANNGYWGKDPGVADQCKKEGNAWVEVTVYRSAGR